MFIKKIDYTDYNGTERSEDFYFNFTKAEILNLEMTTPGGIKDRLETLVQKQDTPALVEFFSSMILSAYGEKSADGKRFIKSPALSEAFSQTEAYSNYYVSLTTNADEALAFVNALFPEKVLNEISSELKKNEETNAKFYNETMSKVQSASSTAHSVIPVIPE
jgi:hypothetical protein